MTYKLVARRLLRNEELRELVLIVATFRREVRAHLRFGLAVVDDPLFDLRVEAGVPGLLEQVGRWSIRRRG